MKRPEYTSELTIKEFRGLIVYVAAFLVAFPLLITLAAQKYYISAVTANFALYAGGTVYMATVLARFFRREFDPFCDRLGRNLLEIFISYLAMLAMNTLVATLIYSLLGINESNPNNAAVIQMAGEEPGLVTAMTVFLAPLTEEPLFRAGLFGMLRKRSRTLAYVVTVLIFSFYHVWSYMLIDIRYLVFILQYIPISFLLCRCYERTNSIWSSIFLHMLVNGISMGIWRAM